MTRMLWEQPDGTGQLTHHTCLWQQGPIMQRDRSLLPDAVEAVRDNYDLVVWWGSASSSCARAI